MLDLILNDERERLAAVARYDVRDTPPDGAFDRITALAARLLKVPVAIVSILDADRIWFKSHHGGAVGAKQQRVRVASESHRQVAPPSLGRVPSTASVSPSPSARRRHRR